MLQMHEIQRTAPSVFAQSAYTKTSDKYKFFPTEYIVQALMDKGFNCTSARQARTRIEGKQDFVKHVLRFRHEDLQSMTRKVGDIIPEIVLTNSHDGSSSYNLTLGMFRLACLNGLMVKSGNIQEVRIRHSGHDRLIDDVIDGTFRVIDEAPKAIEQVRHWQGIDLSRNEQEAFARSALELRGTKLAVEPGQALHARRSADYGSDLWTTMNVIQENLIKGGLTGKNDKGQRRAINKVNSVIKDSSLNRAIWMLTEQMAQLKTA
jgi:hypothetical protein